MRELYFFAPLAADRDLNVTNEVLPEIENRLALRRLEHLPDFDSLLLRNEAVRLLFKAGHRVGFLYCIPKEFRLCRQIHGFAIVKFGIEDLCAKAFPAFICGNDLDLAVRVFNFDLAYHAHVIRKIVRRSVISEAADCPALASDDLDAIFFVLQKRGRIVFLVKNAVRIARRAGRQQCVANLLSVDHELVKSHSACARRRSSNRLFRRKLLCKSGGNASDIPSASNPYSVHLLPPNIANEKSLERSAFEASGAGSRGRTDTVSLPQDFESSASANSTIPAYCGRIRNHKGYYSIVICKNQVIFQKK